jgi:hypothetical protein
VFRRRIQWSRIRATGRPSRPRPLPRGSRIGFWCRARRRDCLAAPPLEPHRRRLLRWTERRRSRARNQGSKVHGGGNGERPGSFPFDVDFSSGGCEARAMVLNRQARSSTIPWCASTIRLIGKREFLEPQPRLYSYHHRNNRVLVTKSLANSGGRWSQICVASWEKFRSPACANSSRARRRLSSVRRPNAS